MADHFDSFEEFWPYYLRQHSDPTNRALHVAGTVGALTAVGVAAVTKRPKLALLAPVVGIGAAWIGHALIEQNPSATFENPLYSFAGDLKLTGLTFTGQIGDELRRHGIDAIRRLPK